MKDIYVYENTNVLINKLNIRDLKELDKAEGVLVTTNLISVLNNPFPIKSTLDIKKIHKLLFSDLYDWAGQTRKMNMYKSEPVLDGLSVNYSEYTHIDDDLKKLDNYFKSINWKNLSKKDTIDYIVQLISRLWRIHCFREGNTRTVTTFLYLFMKQINLKVDTKFIGEHAKFFRNALVMASIDQYSEYEHLTEILMDSISTKVKTGDYKTIRQYEVDKYEYTTHKYKD